MSVSRFFDERRVTTSLSAVNVLQAEVTSELESVVVMIQLSSSDTSLTASAIAIFEQFCSETLKNEPQQP